ncbi:hypothetical protein EV360DRAFT_85167 [Lentinula raphanica]|nr:hypothetical protein EV360DRAFT_85167 [Lentinula raphanica]
MEAKVEAEEDNRPGLLHGEHEQGHMTPPGKKRTWTGLGSSNKAQSTKKNCDADALSSDPTKFIGRPRASTAYIVTDHAVIALVAAAQFSPVPYLGMLASITSTIWRTVQNAKDNADSLNQLASSVFCLATTVTDTYNHLHSDPSQDVDQDSTIGKSTNDPFLDRCVESLISTLKEIEGFVKSLMSRNIFRRILSSKSDVVHIRDYRDHLQKALDRFTLQSNITLQSRMFKLSEQQDDMIKTQKNVDSTLRSLQNSLQSNNIGTGRSSSSQTNGEVPECIESIPAVTSPVNLCGPDDQTHDMVNPPINPTECSPLSESPTTWVEGRPLPSIQTSPPVSTDYPQAPTSNPFENLNNSSRPSQGNITVNYISGDHHVISHADQSHRENFGNYYTMGVQINRSKKNFAFYGDSGMSRASERYLHI